MMHSTYFINGYIINIRNTFIKLKIIKIKHFQKTLMGEGGGSGLISVQ